MNFNITDKALTKQRIVTYVRKSFSFFLPACLQKTAALTGKPITWEKIAVPRRTSQLHHRYYGPDPPTTYKYQITSAAQDYGLAHASDPANQKAQLKDSVLTLPMGSSAQVKGHDPDDLSTCSDFESGVADLSSQSSSGGDDSKDPDLE